MSCFKAIFRLRRILAVGPPERYSIKTKD